MNKPLIYLIQGEARLVESFRHLAARKQADVILLTYDQPIPDAIYFPDSTWAEGRNHLLAEAKKQGDYQYYIFCDDDLEFSRGGWDEFEEDLFRYKPAIGVPVVPKTQALQVPKLNYQVFHLNDEQMMAFHRDVVADNLLFPYQTQFDEIHWWASCEIQQTLIQNFYLENAIQFNRIEILNNCTRRYDDSREKRRHFKVAVEEWLVKQFKSKYRRCIREFHKGILGLLFKTWRFSRHVKSNEIRSFRRSRKDVETLLNSDSELYSQFKD